MASATKLDDGLFSISWSPNIQYRYSRNGRIAVTQLPDVFTSCKLNYNNGGNKFDLKLNFVLSNLLKSSKREISFVLAAMDYGVQRKMNLNKTKWITSWAAPAGISFEYDPPTTFNILIHLTPVLAFPMTKGAKHVLDHILNLWETKMLSDVTFRCHGKEIKAHVMILASCSPVLAAMFNNDFKESQERIVEIKDFTPAIFSRLLCFMYTGDASLETDLTEEDVAKLLIAADKYHVDNLKEECALHLSRNLDMENAAHFLILAHLHNSAVLLESALEFMSENAKAVCSRKDWMDNIHWILSRIIQSYVFERCSVCVANETPPPAGVCFAV